MYVCTYILLQTLRRHNSSLSLAVVGNSLYAVTQQQLSGKKKKKNVEPFFPQVHHIPKIAPPPPSPRFWRQHRSKICRVFLVYFINYKTRNKCKSKIYYTPYVTVTRSFSRLFTCRGGWCRCRVDGPAPYTYSTSLNRLSSTNWPGPIE